MAIGKMANGFRSIAAFFALACALAGTGCVSVQPHQKEALTKPGMDPALEADEQRFRAHLRESREGSTSSAGAAGGGCGCN